MFSEAKARRVTQFIECLKHTKGEFQSVHAAVQHGLHRNPEEERKK